jgi:hypothetical protein
MITVGIVGHEAAKFTAATEARARALIRRIFARTGAGRVVSGACPLGGIDVWAIEEGRAAGLAVEEFPPRVNNWPEGFKPRNIQIAEASTVVYSIVVAELPETYTGRRFGLCYHCGTDTHVKSGGCWTVKYALQIGRRGYVIVIH